MTPADFFNKKAEQLKEGGGKLASINSKYQFDITGDGGGQWVIELTEACQEVREGSEEDAACTIAMSDENFVGLIKGTLRKKDDTTRGKSIAMVEVKKEAQSETKV